MSDTKKTELAPAEEQKKLKPELLKNVDYEEDEFEEFETLNANLTEISNTNTDSQDINVWEDNWDDECAETDFSKQLKLAFCYKKKHSLFF